MAVFTIKKYHKEDHDTWDTFVSQAKNGSFLFYRDFMEYHADRFEDFSLLIYDASKLIALLPANRAGMDIHSHQGLTYGGLLLKESIGGKKVNEILKSLLSFLKANEVIKLNIKAIPQLYHQIPSNEFIFFFQKNGGILKDRDLNLAIDYRNPLSIHKSKGKQFRKRESLGFQIEETPDLSDFWNEVLIPRLQEKHGVQPVHSLSEIQLLRDRFPKNIRQFTIRLQNKLLAGITIFQNEKVIKSQYGATTEAGEQQRALDFLFITLIQRFKKEGFLYFDMGTVTENNFGLLKQKEELGCEIYTQDFYELALDHI